MTKKHVPTFVICMGLCLFMAGCKEPAQPVKLSPPDVTVAKPIQKTVDIYSEIVGQIDSPQTVELRARVEGFLKEVNFKEGAEVKKGDLMFTIDPGQYEVSRLQAITLLESAKVALQKANDVKDIEVDKANIVRDEAQLINAIQKVKDMTAALAANAVPREKLDDANTAQRQAEAGVSSSKAVLAQAEADFLTRVAQAKASVAAAEASLAQAELNLSYTKIYSPLDGRAGLTQVKIGGFVGRGEPTLLATVSMTDPIYVSFSVSEREVFAVHEARLARGLGTPNETNIKVQLILENGSLYPSDGKLNFIDRALDPSTGTLTLRAEFPNADHFLRPGNYGKIRLLVYDKPNALLIDDRAVNADQSGKFVLVVNDKNIVEQRNVKVGVSEKGSVVIEEGLKADDRVIVKGLQRARPGKPVTPIDAPTPLSDAKGERKADADGEKKADASSEKKAP